MPKSCKCILDRMVFKGAMTEKERDKILRNIKTDWIPVTERLPEKEGYYLANKKDTIGGSDYLDVVYWLGDEWATFSIITAWMPLPEPYEEGAEE